MNEDAGKISESCKLFPMSCMRSSPSANIRNKMARGLLALTLVRAGVLVQLVGVDLARSDRDLAQPIRTGGVSISADTIQADVVASEID
jgi:hypothetical protein